MQSKTFGSTGREVAVVGQGTWPIPDVAALRRGIELGMTHIDTAEMYGNGRSEELVGEAIAQCKRDELFLVSKFLPENGTRKKLVKSCEQSLRRLRVNELDCYLLHWRGDFDLDETMQALEELMDSGKVRSIGVSNLDPWDLREASAALKSATIVCNQVYYNLLERTVEEHELPWAREHGSALVAYTPLGGLREHHATLERIAIRHGVEPATIALAFLLRDPKVFVIPKAATLAHVEANAKAGSIVLSADDVAELDAIAPVRERVGPLPTN